MVQVLVYKAYQGLGGEYLGNYAERYSKNIKSVIGRRDDAEQKNQKQKKSFNQKGLVFINFRTGMPNKNSSCDTHLYKLCDEAGIKRFCMHALRHTYATRAIENGLAAA